MADILNTLLWIVGFFSIAYTAGRLLDNSKNNEEIQNNLNAIRKEKSEVTIKKEEIAFILEEISKKQVFLDGALKNFNKSFLEGRRWLSTMFDDLAASIENAEARLLAKKKNPALKAAEQIKETNKSKREAIAKLKFLEYQLLSYKEKFPFLEEYEEELLNEEITTLEEIEYAERQAEADPSRRYLSRTEYQKLSISERNQLALDRYLSGNLNRSAIGKLYERYLGYCFEKSGFKVEYHGIIKGFEDLGRDLICTRENQIYIIQAKCWGSYKTIHESHICQLFGTTTHYKDQNKEYQVKAILITSTKLSDIAKKMANVLGIFYKEEFQLNKNYPMIKCNISKKTGEKIYHLPFDQQYDRVKIEPEAGELYAATVLEAESKGFRRAFKHYAN